MTAGFEGLYKSLQKIQSSLLLNSDGRKLKEKWLAKSNNFVQVLIYHSLNILLKSFPNIFRICRQFQNPFSRLKRLFCLCNSFTCLHNGCCRQFSTDFTLFPNKTIPKQSSQDHSCDCNYCVAAGNLTHFPLSHLNQLHHCSLPWLEDCSIGRCANCKSPFIHAFFLLAIFIFFQLHNFSAFTNFANT